MKTWEMIKELTENPEKQFRVIDREFLKVDNGLEGIHFIDGYGSIYTPELEWTWEEVKRPVTFMEAIESGKMVGVEHTFSFEEAAQNFHERAMKVGDILHNLGNYPDWAIKEIITQGKWYIED